MYTLRHGGNEPITGAMPIMAAPLTFEQINREQLVRERREHKRLRWRSALIAEIRQYPAVAISFIAIGLGGLVIEALGYEAYRAISSDGRMG